MDSYLWGGIVLISLATVVTRAGMLLLPGELRWPAWVDAALRFAPACALAGIIAPDLVFAASDADGGIDWTHPKLLAGLAGIALFATSRSMIVTIGGGMAIFTVLRWAGLG